MERARPEPVRLQRGWEQAQGKGMQRKEAGMQGSAWSSGLLAFFEPVTNSQSSGLLRAHDLDPASLATCKPGWPQKEPDSSPGRTSLQQARAQAEDLNPSLSQS